MSTIRLEGKGAVYVRISEDDQDTTRQRKSTSEWIVRQGHQPTAVAVYEDVGWKRHQADRRPEFQRMLRDADDGRIQWIVCDALDRFGTKNKNQLLAYLYRLQEAGCKLFTVNGKEWTGTDLLTLIEAGMEGEKSEKELRDKSERVLEAMRVMAEEGTWLGGRIPYGCDAVAFRMSQSGQLSEQWRVRIVGKQSRLKISLNGGERVYDGENNFPATEQDEILQLRPTQETARLDVIRNIFHRFDTENINFNQLANQLETQKVPPPPYSKGWQYFHLRELLVNPVYVGKPGWNRRTHGQYTQWKGGMRHSKKPDSGMKHHEREDWIMPKEAIFTPIVDPEVFERVQKKIAALPEKKRSPKSASMWLAGLVYCANCGRAMCGKKDTRTKKPQYICSTYVNARGPRAKCGCTCNIVAHDLIEEKLRGYLAEAGLQLSDMISGVKRAMAGKPDALKAAISRAVAAHKKMRELVGADFVRMNEGDKAVMLELPDTDVGYGAILVVPAWDTTRLEQLYRDAFEDQRWDWENKLDELRKQQDTLFQRMDKIAPTSTNSLARVQAELDQVDAHIRETEAKLENAADMFANANAEYDRLNADWEEAQRVVETEVSARRKAEAVKKVVARINLRFKPTGRKRPVSQLLSIEWMPVGAVGISPRHLASPHHSGAQSESSSQLSGCPSP